MSYPFDVLAEENRDLRARVAKLEAWIAGMDDDAKKVVVLYETRVAELEAERDLWRERFEDERRDHKETIKHCDRAMDEWSA